MNRLSGSLKAAKPKAAQVNQNPSREKRAANDLCDQAFSQVQAARNSDGLPPDNHACDAAQELSFERRVIGAGQGVALGNPIRNC